MDFGPLDISSASYAIGTAAAWAQIPAENLGRNDKGAFQLARLFVSVDAGTPGTEFTLYLALASADRATVYGLTAVTCTVLTGRATGGTSGDYLCSVSISGREVADMLGAMDLKSVAGSLAWFIGCPDGLPAGASHVYVRGAFTSIV